MVYVPKAEDFEGCRFLVIEDYVDDPAQYLSYTLCHQRFETIEEVEIYLISETGYNNAHNVTGTKFVVYELVTIPAVEERPFKLNGITWE